MTEVIIKRPTPANSLCCIVPKNDTERSVISQELITCSDAIVTKIAGLAKLKAGNPADTVNGHVTIEHGQTEHVYRFVFYDQDEAPNGKHATRFQKLVSIPTKAALEALI